MGAFQKMAAISDLNDAVSGDMRGGRGALFLMTLAARRIGHIGFRLECRSLNGYPNHSFKWLLELYYDQYLNPKSM